MTVREQIKEVVAKSVRASEVEALTDVLYRIYDINSAEYGSERYTAGYKEGSIAGKLSVMNKWESFLNEVSQHINKL